MGQRLVKEAALMESGRSPDGRPAMTRPRLSARLRRRVSHLSDWETLERFGLAPLHQVLVLFPVVSVALSLADVASAPIIGFHVGLGLLFLGMCVHRWRSPRLVQAYRNSFDYIRTEVEVTCLRPAAETMLRVSRSQLARQRKILATLHPECFERLQRSVDRVSEHLDGRASLEPNLVAEWMLALWLFMTRSAPVTRLIVTSCYAAGASLVTLASIALSWITLHDAWF
jgi:hypothetical protein